MIDDPLTQAVQLINTGEKQKAQVILSKYLNNNRDSEEGWLLLARCMEEDDKKRFCLNKVLEVNPQNEGALKMVAKLDEATGSYPPVESLVSPKDATLQIPAWAMPDFLAQMSAEDLNVDKEYFPELESEEVWETESWYQEAAEELEPVEEQEASKPGWEEEVKRQAAQKPRPLIYVLVAVAATVGAIFVVFFLANGTDVTCRRVEGNLINCVLTPQVLGLVDLGTENVDDVRQARLAEDCDDGCAYRVELNTAAGMEPVSPIWTSDYAHHKFVADQINALITNPSQKIVEIEDPPGVIEWGIVAAAALIGVLAPWISALIQIGKWVAAGE
ncbi:MAG: hypothetical protein JXB38_19675 [Anaerolineales bacterium]|nr:hypothetical protein [Anaerolineales bacterium]